MLFSLLNRLALVTAASDADTIISTLEQLRSLVPITWIAWYVQTKVHANQRAGVADALGVDP